MTWAEQVADMDETLFDVMGESATYTPTVGDPSAITVVVGEELIGRGADDTGERTYATAQILVRSSDVSQPVSDDAITVGSKTYSVGQQEGDIRGVNGAWELMCRREIQTERGSKSYHRRKE